MLRCLWRAREAGRMMYAARAEHFIFPANTAAGCLSVTREDRHVLAKWGNDLRQTYATAARLKMVRYIPRSGDWASVCLLSRVKRTKINGPQNFRS